MIVETTEAEGFRISPDRLRDVMTPRTKALILNSPSNPTGTAYEREELEELAEIVLQNRIYVISDEIYEKIIYDGVKHYSIASLPGMAERTLTLNGFSKAYSMTGWRVGYVAATRS